MWRFAASTYISKRVRPLDILSLLACKKRWVPSTNPKPPMHLSLIWNPQSSLDRETFSNMHNKGWVAIAKSRGLKGQPCWTDLLIGIHSTRYQVREINDLESCPSRKWTLEILSPNPSFCSTICIKLQQTKSNALLKSSWRSTILCFDLWAYSIPS